MATNIPQQERTTRAVLSFQPSEECPLPSIDGDVVDAQTLLAENSCHCEYVVEGSINEGRSIEHTSQRHEQPCACHVFAQYDSVPDILAVEQEGIVVSVFLSSHDVVWDLVADLRSVSNCVSLRRITSDADDVAANTREVSLTELTEKQQRALELAVERGYYEQPSAVSLSDIAATLGISKQALSQRLKSAERKILGQVINP